MASPPFADVADHSWDAPRRNQCIAQAINRFPIDVYHVNDFHGALALLHLLPRTVPAALSLHNAEFQGMWPMRTRAECKEVSKVFNLPPAVVKKFCQFGSGNASSAEYVLPVCSVLF